MFFSYNFSPNTHACIFMDHHGRQRIVFRFTPFSEIGAHMTTKMCGDVYTIDTFLILSMECLTLFWYSNSSIHESDNCITVITIHYPFFLLFYYYQRPFIDIGKETNVERNSSKKIMFLNVIIDIPPVSSYTVYILKLTRYYRACNQYSDFWYRNHLLKRRGLKQWYIDLMVKSSLEHSHCPHYGLVVRYEISIYKNVNWSCAFCVDFFFILLLLSTRCFTWFDCMSITTGVL